MTSLSQMRKLRLGAQDQRLVAVRISLYAARTKRYQKQSKNKPPKMFLKLQIGA